jgi:polysaccharide pyruvyl transferase WcaK-like protein
MSNPASTAIHANTPLKRQTICFWGLFGQQNLGNECTLQAIHHHAKRRLPAADAACICTVPEDTSARHQLPAIPIARRYLATSTARTKQGRGPAAIPRKIFARLTKEALDAIAGIRILRRSNALIVPGTGFLTDAATGPLGWPYDIFKWSFLAKLCGCKLLYVSVGAGPIRHRLSRWLIRRALALADFRSYRDSASKECLASIGLRTRNDRIYPDLAFNMPESALPRRAPANRRPVVGVGLMTYAGEMRATRPDQSIYQRYLHALLVFVRWLLAHEYDVRLLTGDVTYDAAVQRDFLGLLKEHEPLFGGPDARIACEPVLSVDNLLSQLARTDLVVATRFHNLVLALVLEKPVISLAFHHKCVSLMSDMGLARYCHDIHHVEPEKLIAQFCDLVANEDQLKRLIRAKTKEFREALNEQYELVFDSIAH